MKIKILGWALVLSGILIVVLAVIAFLKPATKAVSVEIPAQEIKAVFDKIDKVQKIIEDIDFNVYVVKTETDTFYYDSTTLYGDIPIVDTYWDSNFVLLINKQEKDADFYGIVRTRGEALQVTFGLYPSEFNIEMQKPSDWDFDLSVGSWIDQNYKWHGALMAGLWYKKFALDAQMRIEPVKREEDTEYQIKFLAGMVYEIL